jgi:hypothetical protein
LLALFSFDGYRWLRDGAAIAGQTAQSYTPTAGGLGHQLACTLTVTYPGPFLVTALATRAPITVQPAPSGGGGGPPPPPVSSLAAVSTAGPVASLELGCESVAGQTCMRRVAIVVRERRRGTTILAVNARRGHTPKTVTVSVTVARGPYSVPAGQTATFPVALNRTGQRLLDQFYTVPAGLNLTGR